MKVLVAVVLVVLTQSLQVFGELKEEKQVKIDIYTTDDPPNNLLDASFNICTTSGRGKHDGHITTTFEESHTINDKKGTTNGTSDLTESSVAMKHDNSYFVSEADHVVTKYAGDMMLIEHIVLAGDNEIAQEDSVEAQAVYTGTVNRRVIDLSLGKKKMEQVVTFYEVITLQNIRLETGKYLTQSNISFTNALIGSNKAFTSFGTMAVTTIMGGDILSTTCRGSQDYYFVKDDETLPFDLLTTFNIKVDEKYHSLSLEGRPILGGDIDEGLGARLGETPLSVLFWSKAYRTRLH